MFDFDLGKLLLIGVVALIFIPPKDLPGALRQLGKFIGQARRIAGDFQSQFNEALREAELTDLKDEFSHLKKSASLEGALAHVADAIEPLESIGKPNPAAPSRAAIEAEAAAEAQAALDAAAPQMSALDAAAPQEIGPPQPIAPETLAPPHPPYVSPAQKLAETPVAESQS
jgi:sec-independent protein translocase protein TatB